MYTQFLLWLTVNLPNLCRYTCIRTPNPPMAHAHPLYMRDMWADMSIMCADSQELCVMCVMCKIICSNFNDLGMISNSFTISFHNIFDERCQFFDNEVIGKGGLQNYYPSSKCPMSDCC